MVRVVMWSTKALSWEMTITALALFIRKSSSHSIDSMSRWFVGSSKSSRSGFCNSSLASSMRMRQPPENSEVWRVKSLRSKPSPSRMRSTSSW